MKDGMTIGELAVEVKRRTEQKVDYWAPTRDLVFGIQPLEVAQAQALESGKTVVVDGGRHVALADWYANGMQRDDVVRGGRNGLAVKSEPCVTQLVVPSRGNGNAVLPINELAHDQIAAHLGIPSAYYDRLRADHPALLAENVNTLFKAAPEREVRMVRSLDGVVRAFLSDSYDPLDNWDLMRYIMPLFRGEDTDLGGGRVVKCLRGADGKPLKVTFRSCNITDSELYIKIVADVLTKDLAPGVTVRAGALLKNSEVGRSMVSCLPFYEVLQCTNGAFITEFGTTRRHVGKARGDDGNMNDAARFFSNETKKARDKAFFLGLADVVRGTMTEVTFDRMLEPLRNAMGVAITGSPSAVVEKLGAVTGLGEADEDAILGFLLTGGRTGPDGKASMFDLSQAVTRHAQDVESYDHSIELEGVGGDIVTMSKQMWKEISEATGKARRRRGANS